MVRNNALNALMSGSGSAVFGVYENEKEAEIAHSNLRNKYSFACLSKSF